MTRLSMVVAAALGVLLSPPTHAATLNFDFSFTTASGSVTGEIDGLTDNATSAPSAVYIDYLPGGGLPTPFLVVAPIGPDSFTVANGLITAAQFSGGKAPCVGSSCILEVGLGEVDFSLRFPSGGNGPDATLLIGLTQLIITASGEVGGLCIVGPCVDPYQLSFTGTDLAFTAVPLSAAPELSTWAMVILGFAGVGFMAYQRKSKPALMAA